MSLARYSAVVQDLEGNAVPDALITVRKEQPGKAMAALKADREGGTPMDNPFNAGPDGSFFFHVVGGAYEIVASKDGETYTRNFVPIGLGAETDTITSGLTQRVHTSAGAVDVAADDADTIIIRKAVGAPTTVNLPSAMSRTRPLRIVDGKGDAATNLITVHPFAGDTVFNIADYQPTVDGNGGQLLLTPLEDGTGWF